MPVLSGSAAIISRTRGGSTAIKRSRSSETGAAGSGLTVIDHYPSSERRRERSLAARAERVPTPGGLGPSGNAGRDLVPAWPIVMAQAALRRPVVHQPAAIDGRYGGRHIAQASEHVEIG